MLKRKKTPVANAGHEMNKGLPIQQIRVTNGCRYYQVDLGSLFFGKGGHKNFASAKKARAFAAKSTTKPADGGIKAMPISDSTSTSNAAEEEVKTVELTDSHREALEVLSPFKASLYEVACFYAEYHDSVEYINNTRTLIEQFIADSQIDLQRISDSHAQMNSADEKEAPAPASESMEKAVDDEEEAPALVSEPMEEAVADEAVTLQFPEVKHEALEEISDPSNEIKHEAAEHADSAEALVEYFITEEQVQADLAELQPVSHVDTKETSIPVWDPPVIPKNVKAQKTYTPAHVARLMKTAKPELVPYLALGMFGGLRTTEILKLRWRDVDFELAEIQVNAGQSKAKGRRTVHMQSNLGQFLVPFRGQPKEYVVPYKQENLLRWTRNLFEELGIKSIRQGARHSFAMYYLASHSSDETMKELGYTESAKLHKYYRGLTDKRREKAAKYFAIAPLDKVEIIPLKKKSQKKAA